MRGNAMNHKTIVMDRVTFILIYIVNFKKQNQEQTNGQIWLYNKYDG